MYALLTRTACALALACLVAEQSGAAPEGAPGSPAGAPLVSDAPMNEDMRCTEPGKQSSAWLDRMQRDVYTGVCGTARWFDGLFGNPRYDQDSDETFGRIGIFQTYDRRDRLDTRLRLRARFALPALKDRFRLTLGRGEEQELVEERAPNTESPPPLSFQGVQDDAWLLGLGYSKQNGLEEGFDFGIGVRLNTPLDPYVKASYRHNFVFGPETMLRFRETPFWRNSRGLGATTQVALDHLATDTVLLRWNNSATVAGDTEGFEWTTSVAAYQSFGQRRAISYSTFLHGETRADVPIQNYGVETRYRQNVLRKWLFVDLSASLTWPREELLEQRRVNPGVGLGFEMYFGPVPDIEMR